jgi:hypothetical protein
MKFKGTDNYVATQDLMLAVNAAIALKRPLLVKGEPGTGKTMLAEEVAQSLGLPLLQWHIKSTTKAQQGLYEYDAVSRLRDSQMADPESAERVKDINNYILKGVLWQAFTAEQPVACVSSTAWSFIATKRANSSRPKIVPWCSSHPTMKKSCPMLSCAAAFFTTSSFPTLTPCATSCRCISPPSSKIC